MTEGDLLRTALIIPPRGRAVVCSWASVPGVFCAPFVFWQSRFAGCIFCALWAGLVFAVCPFLSRTPFFLAISGKLCPGLLKSSGLASSLTTILVV